MSVKKVHVNKFCEYYSDKKFDIIYLYKMKPGIILSSFALMFGKKVF